MYFNNGWRFYPHLPYYIVWPSLLKQKYEFLPQDTYLEVMFYDFSTVVMSVSLFHRLGVKLRGRSKYKKNKNYFSILLFYANKNKIK